MKREEAKEIMTARVEEIKKYFSALPFSLSVETEYLTSGLRSTENIKKARIIAVSLVIKEEGGDEFYLTVCADCHSGKVIEGELERSFKEYEKEAKDFAKKLSDSSEPTALFKKTVKDTNEESERFRQEMKKRYARSFIITLLGLIICVGVIVLTTIFA